MRALVKPRAFGPNVLVTDIHVLFIYIDYFLICVSSMINKILKTHIFTSICRPSVAPDFFSTICWIRPNKPYIYLSFKNIWKLSYDHITTSAVVDNFHSLAFLVHITLQGPSPPLFERILTIETAPDWLLVWPFLEFKTCFLKIRKFVVFHFNCKM